MSDIDVYRWRAVALRAIDAVGLSPKSIVILRDHAGRPEVTRAFIGADAAAGHQVIVEELPADRIRSMLVAGDVEGINRRAFDSARAAEDAHGVIVLSGDRLDLDEVTGPASAAWRESQHTIASIDERRRTPFVLVAVPTGERAKALSLSLDDLDERVLPAMAIVPEDLTDAIRRVLAAIEVQNDARLTIRSGSDCALTMRTVPGRPLHSDDGRIDAADRAAGAIVINLPAGSVYTTVDESATRGNIWLANAGPASDVTLTFEEGRIVDVKARFGAEQLIEILDSHSGESRRIGHVGVGLNPVIHDFIGWTIFDEHRSGAVFLSLGENRYMGGQNDSSLNLDFVVTNATLVTGTTTIVERGTIIV